MADREKLTELVGQVQDCGCDVTDVVEMNYVENSVLVDHLIANGVTVRERGRWILKETCGTNTEKYHCSVCDKIPKSLCMEDFCPNCGADMK